MRVNEDGVFISYFKGTMFLVLSSFFFKLLLLYFREFLFMIFMQLVKGAVNILIFFGYFFRLSLSGFFVVDSS